MEKRNGTYKLIVSTGGTGGHIFPAIAVAKEFENRHPDSDILFVGANGKMEMQKVPEAGYRIIGLTISGFHRKITLKNLLFPIKLLLSLRKADKIIKNFKPDAVVGFGGFASGPVLRKAARKKIPTLIQEQNSYAGITNKLLGKKVDTVCVAYDNMDRYFPSNKVVITGNPVRSDIININGKKPTALEFFNLVQSRPTILVIGGSLGARTINESLILNLDTIVNSETQLIWQIGKIYYGEFKERLANMDLSNIRYFEFLEEMDLAYAAADVVISRAGAISVSELCIAGKPTVFVPSPNVAEDHQTKNAMALVSKEAAVVVKDTDARKELVGTAMNLTKDKDRMARLSDNIKRLAKPDATKDIVNEIEKLLN
ncbi:undecaprenyldiphospho-muramoylpentapeptide beta-N-acetylglucosaminyltransferase [Bacteroidota bacterium]